MKETTKASPGGGVPMLLSMLKQSPKNARKFGGVDVTDLVASISAKGVVIPLLVRPLDGGRAFEIVDGHRRFAAALAIANGKDEEAKKLVETIPVTTAELTDDEAAELQIVTNVQRASFHYLDESEAFQDLVRRRYDAEGIAAKVGKPVKYVLRRLALAGLTDSLKKLAVSGALPEKYAELLAPLSPATQKEIAERVVYRYGSGKGAEVAFASLHDLRRQIQNVAEIDLARAPFALDDEVLVPEAGPCTTCPKRVGTNPALFDIAKGETCTDRRCYQEKLKAHVAALEKAYAANQTPLLKITKEYGGERRKGVLDRGQFAEAKAGSCEHVKNAVLMGVEYDSKQSVGDVVTVCAEPSCKIHRPERVSFGRSSPQDRAFEKAKLRKKALAVETAQRQVNRLAAKIHDGVYTPGHMNQDDLARVVRAFLDHMGFDALKAIAKNIGADKPKLKDPRQFILKDLGGAKSVSDVLALLYRATFVDVLMGLEGGYYGTDDKKALRATLAHYKIDPDEIAGIVRGELKAKWAKADARGKGKKKPKKGKTPGARAVHELHTGAACRYCGCTESKPCLTLEGNCAWIVKPKKIRGKDGELHT